MLEGFEKYNVSPGLVSMTITPNGIGFSKTAVERMERCEYVIVMIDYAGKRFAVQRSDEDEEGSSKFYRGGRNVSVRWNNKELINTLCGLMNWDISDHSYKVNGVYSRDDNALIFDLKTAEPSSRNRKEVDGFG